MCGGGGFDGDGVDGDGSCVGLDLNHTAASRAAVAEDGAFDGVSGTVDSQREPGAGLGDGKITGFAGWVTWLALHLIMLLGFRNRANVLVNWDWNYLTYDRASRLIAEPALCRLISNK